MRVVSVVGDEGIQPSIRATNAVKFDKSQVVAGRPQNGKRFPV